MTNLESAANAVLANAKEIAGFADFVMVRRDLIGALRSAIEPKAPRTISKEEADVLERSFWDSVVVIDEERCWIKGCRKPKGHRGWCQPGPTL